MTFDEEPPSGDLPLDEDVLAFLDFLNQEPPYEAIGRVIHAGSDLDAGLFALCRHYGVQHDKAVHMRIAGRVELLTKKSGLPVGVLERIAPAMENRNVLAHGTWLNTPGGIQAFMKPEKAAPDKLRGPVVDADVLEEWRAELQDLADIVRSHYLAAIAGGAAN